MSEESEVKRDGARAVSNSGRGHYAKGDALLDIFTVDYKEYAKSFSLSRSVWAKICKDALRNGRSVPALKIILGEGNDKLRLWVVGEGVMDDYLRLREAEARENV